MSKFQTWVDERVEEQLKDYGTLTVDDRVISVIVLLFFPLIVFYFIGHQMFSTGFFSTNFGILESILFYGAPLYWIFTCTVLLLGFMGLSRDVDSFGGLILAAVGFGWLAIVFPFDFTYFADLMPEDLKFLVQWINNDIARIIMVLASIVHLLLAIIAFPIRVGARKELALRKKTNK